MAERERLAAELRSAGERLAKEAERLEGAADQRDHVIATIILNLRRGATAEQILTCWDETGKRSLEGHPIRPTAERGG